MPCHLYAVHVFFFNEKAINFSLWFESHSSSTRFSWAGVRVQRSFSLSSNEFLSVNQLILNQYSVRLCFYRCTVLILSRIARLIESFKWISYCAKVTRFRNKKYTSVCGIVSTSLWIFRQVLIKLWGVWNNWFNFNCLGNIIVLWLVLTATLPRLFGIFSTWF